MRKTCIDMVHTLARKDPRVVFIGSDLSPGLLGAMKEEMSDRHYMEGVAEANIIGMAAGMAMDGYMPFVNTIATFITRRCYEQVALDLCLHDLPVRLIGNGGGVVYAPLGPTHLAVDDFAIMRALPNMAIVAVADADEMTRLMEASLDWPHPLYIRLGKGGDPVVSDEKNGFAIGEAIPMAADANGGVLLVSTGVMTGRALEASETLYGAGIGCDVLHVHTVKPLDVERVVALASEARLVVTVEEHSVIGGLGSAVTDALVERLSPGGPAIRRLGLPDAFARNYGVQDDLLEINGLQPPAIAQAVADAVKTLDAA